MTHNEILQQALAILDDPSGNMLVSENNSFATELCEIVQAMTIIRSASVVRSVMVTIPGASYVTGHDLLPVIDLLQLVPDLFFVINVGIDRVAFDKGSVKTLLIFPNAWKTPGVVTEYWLGGNNLLGVRDVPIYDTVITLLYTPYVFVNNLNDTLAIKDEYAYALQVLLLGFLQARLSRFDLAKQAFQRWQAEVDDASHRIVQMRA